MNEVTLVLFTLLFFVVACSDNKTQTSNNLNWTSDLGKQLKQQKQKIKQCWLTSPDLIGASGVLN